MYRATKLYPNSEEYFKREERRQSKFGSTYSRNRCWADGKTIVVRMPRCNSEKNSPGNHKAYQFIRTIHQLTKQLNDENTPEQSSPISAQLLAFKRKVKHFQVGLSHPSSDSSPIKPSSVSVLLKAIDMDLAMGELAGDLERYVRDRGVSSFFFRRPQISNLNIRRANYLLTLVEQFQTPVQGPVASREPSETQSKNACAYRILATLQMIQDDLRTQANSHFFAQPGRLMKRLESVPTGVLLAAAQSLPEAEQNTISAQIREELQGAVLSPVPQRQQAVGAHTEETKPPGYGAAAAL